MQRLYLVHMTLRHGVRWTLKSGGGGGIGERVRFHNYNKQTNPL